MRIEGVTKRQKELLDIMWTISSRTDLDAWLDTLSLKDQQDAVVLLHVLLLEMIDQELEEDESYRESNEVLQRFML
jgi:hypothetical protein